MTITNYGEIDLESICPNPKNPRRHYDQKKLDELTASVNAKGVIEPIIIRPVKGKKTPYELVAGERRWRASKAAGLATIPAIIRALGDVEAYDFMLIENLQRDDLTDREEAESFVGYVCAHGGDDSIAALAEKTGISPAYIRGRVRVLELPAKVLKAWDEGKLVFGHLQQLLRVAGDPKALKEMSDRLTGSDRWGDGISTVGQVRRWINDLAPALSGAFFPMKETCVGCGSSSTVQKDLFDVDADKARCLSPTCFKKRQNDYLAGHWKETALARTHGTNGFRFAGHGVRYVEHRSFQYGPRPAEKCKECPNFITIIELDGKVETAQACVGKQECFTGATRAKQKLGDKPRDPEAPRASWHGVYFRDIFLRRRIEERLVEVPKEPGVTTLAEMLLLFALIKSENAAREAVAKDMKLSVNRKKSEPLAPIDKAVLTRPKDSRDLVRQMLVAAKALILGGQNETVSWEYGMSIGGHSRAVIAELLGIDLAKEYAVDKDYLDKKTKAEILAFGGKFKLFRPDAAKNLKKSELVKRVLAHGDKLVGLVPAEILK